MNATAFNAHVSQTSMAWYKNEAALIKIRQIITKIALAVFCLAISALLIPVGISKTLAVTVLASSILANITCKFICRIFISRIAKNKNNVPVEDREAQIVRRLDLLEKRIQLPILPELDYDASYNDYIAYISQLTTVFEQRNGILNNALSEASFEDDLDYKIRLRDFLLKKKLDDLQVLEFAAKLERKMSNKRFIPEPNKKFQVREYSSDFSLSDYDIDPSNCNNLHVHYNTFRNRLKSGTRSPHTILGVKENAEFSIITKAYRIYALALHPDKNNETSERMNEATLLFNVMQEAYGCLKP